MLIATVTSFGYRLMFLLHILAVIVAFAPAFVWPIMSVRFRKAGQAPGPVVSGFVRANSVQVHGPALVAVGIFGFGLIGMSDKAWEFSQSWVSMAMGIWIVMLGIVWGLLIPAERKIEAGDESAEKKVSMFGGILHLLLLLMLIVMIWKPGL